MVFANKIFGACEILLDWLCAKGISCLRIKKQDYCSAIQIIALSFIGCFLATCTTSPSNFKDSTAVSTAIAFGQNELKERNYNFRNVPIYQLLLAEFALRYGHYDFSLDQHLLLVKEHPDPLLLKTTVHLAVLSENYSEAFATTKLWLEFEGSSLEVSSMYVALAVKLNVNSAAEREMTDIYRNLDLSPTTVLRSLLHSFEVVNFTTSDYQMGFDLVVGLGPLLDSSSEFLELFSILSFQAKRYRRTMQLINDLARLDGLNLKLIDAIVSQVGQEMKPEEVLVWLRRLSVSYPNNKQLTLWQANLLNRSERYEDARNLVEKLHSSFPVNNRVAFTLALLYLQTEQFEKAKKLFVNLLDGNYRTHDVNFYLGRIAEIEGRYDVAVSHYQAVPHDGSENFLSAQIRRARILSQNDGLQSSLRVLSDLLQSFPDKVAEIAIVKGEILSDKGRHSDAMKAYDEALEVVNYDTAILYSRAMVAERIGRIDILERDLRRILAIEPDNAEVLNALGYTLTNATDRHDEAYLLIEKAMNLRPNDFYILDSMGWVCYRLGKLHDSIRFLREAYNIEPDAEIVAHLIEVLWVDDRHDEARELWVKSIKKYPDDHRILELSDKLGL